MDIKRSIWVGLLVVVNLFGCKKNLSVVKDFHPTSIVSLGTITLLNPLRSYGDSKVTGANTSYYPKNNGNNLYSLNGSTIISSWPNVFSGNAYVQYSSRTVGIGIIKDTISILNTTNYKRNLINDTYDISLSISPTTHLADTFIRFSAIDTGYVINKSGPINFQGITSDAVITMATSTVASGSKPTFNIGTGTSTQKFQFGTSNGYYFLYVKGNTNGTLSLTVPSGQNLNRTLTVTPNVQYNAVVSQTSIIGPLAITFAPFSLNTLNIGQGVGTVNVSTYAGNGQLGSVNGPSLSASFNNPNALTVDNFGNIFIADANNNLIRKIDTYGNVTTLAGNGSQGSTDGPGLNASFYKPSGIVADNQGNVYVADQFNNRIRRVDGNGNVTTLRYLYPGYSFVGFTSGNNQPVSFPEPYSIALDLNGYIIITGTGGANYYVSKLVFTPGQSLFTVNYQFFNSNSSIITNLPLGLAVDSQNNIYTCVGQNIIRISAFDGNATIFAGTGANGSKDGSTLTASFNYPWGLAFDRSGNLFVAEFGNNKIRRIDLGGNVTTYAGSGVSGTENGMASLASFSNPQSLGFDTTGNLYVADTHNNLIRKIVSNK